MEEILRAELPGLGLTPEEEQVKRLCDFARAVLRKNEVMNLTAITDPAEVARLHLLDSLTVAAVSARAFPPRPQILCPRVSYAASSPLPACFLRDLKPSAQTFPPRP